MAWSHLFFDPNGRVKPCCRFDESYGLTLPSIFQSPLSQTLLSEPMEEVRKKMRQGKWVDGCRRCQEEEASGKRSLRQRYNEPRGAAGELNLDVNQPRLLWLEIAMSNHCNLACRFCDSRYSSFWEKIEGKESLKQQVTFDHIRESLSSVVHLKFTGGEPLLEVQNRRILEHMASIGKAGEVSLNYVTNCTIEPDTETLKLWRQFKKVVVTLSIDSLQPEELEYLRWPARFEKIMRVAEFYFEEERSGRISLAVRPTITWLNIINLHKLYAWWRKNTVIGSFNPTHLTYPVLYRLTVLPQKFKDTVRTRLMKDAEVHSSLEFKECIAGLIQFMLSKDESSLWPQALAQVQELDQTRNQSLYFACPYLGTEAKVNDKFAQSKTDRRVGVS